MENTTAKYKWFWIWNFEEEEKWLNKMVSHGWTLKDVKIIRYSFERYQPDEYIVRMEMNDNTSDYENFLEETQVEKVGHCARWHYYRRKASLGPFELFSDIDSKIVHLERIRKLLLAIACLEFGIGLLISRNSSIAFLNYAVGILGLVGTFRIKTKIKTLQEEGMLHE